MNSKKTKEKRVDSLFWGRCKPEIVKIKLCFPTVLYIYIYIFSHNLRFNLPQNKESTLISFLFLSPLILLFIRSLFFCSARQNGRSLCPLIFSFIYNIRCLTCAHLSQWFKDCEDTSNFVCKIMFRLLFWYFRGEKSSVLIVVLYSLTLLHS